MGRGNTGPWLARKEDSHCDCEGCSCPGGADIYTDPGRARGGQVRAAPSVCLPGPSLPGYSTGPQPGTGPYPTLPWTRIIVRIWLAVACRGSRCVWVPRDPWTLGWGLRYDIMGDAAPANRCRECPLWRWPRAIPGVFQDGERTSTGRTGPEGTWDTRYWGKICDTVWLREGGVHGPVIADREPAEASDAGPDRLVGCGHGS